MTWTHPDDTTVVSDHDPGGVQWVVGNVEASALTPYDALTAEPGQTRRTTAVLGIDASHQPLIPGATYASKADARAVLDPTCPADAEDWRVFALVPAQVADGDLRREGDAWSDLLCALALAAGRPGSDPTRPFWCEHDQLHLNADPADFSDDERAQLDVWGFHPDTDGGFYSFRFGSA